MAETGTTFGREELNRSITDRFRQVVRLWPNRPAIIGEDGRCWTYRDLDSWSNQIAGLIHRDQARRHRTIALLLPHGPEFIAAAVGALKSGNAYVGLSVQDSPHRIEKILGQFNTDIVITHPSSE